MVNNKTICFTGHRPDKLIGGYDLNTPRAKLLAKKLIHLLERLIEEKNVKTFISGGALGFDQIAFMCVHHLKKKYPDIQNILAVPFEQQAKNWKNKNDLLRYERMKKVADKIVYVDTLKEYIPKGNKVKTGEFSGAKMQLRNQYMVDCADFVIAAWDGTSGGTKNCVDYASKKNKPIYRLDPKNEFELVHSPF